MTRRNDDPISRLTLRSLPKLLLIALLTCTASVAAYAKTFKLGADQPVVELMMPPDWETTNAKTGVEATTTGVYLSAELIDADDLQDASESSAQFLADRKIKLKMETKSQKAVTVAGLSATQNDWDATDPDGPTRVRISIIDVAKGKLLLVFYWRSAAAEKAHAPEVEFVMNSIKPLR